ncbi:GNAT family N-acetyltransferase [Paenibacillus aurantiacus]|uniref:GNAT family N-acetyltransferase n=1 Tax=Paenibacillus aurantiacus TaxID=1936118 RepID=A0ABV5KJ11_9BACL
MSTQDLFRGSLIRFAAPRPEDADELARFSESYEYLIQVDTENAIPQTPDAYGNAGRANTIEFHLRTLEDDRFIGFVALHSIEWNNQAALVAVGIGDPNERGRGYGIEALRMILRYAFHELNLNRVGLDVISYNEAAYRAYKKAGFIDEGRARSAVLRGGQSYDLIKMGLLRAEWEAMQA